MDTRILISIVVLVIVAGSGTDPSNADEIEPIDPKSAGFQAKVEQLRSEYALSKYSEDEIRRLELIYPETSGKPRYQRSGHQYTTYIVAMKAGLEQDRAMEISFFSQFPDDEVKFSATLAFFYLFEPKYRKEIMAVLHSLHGGDRIAIAKRRLDLYELIRNGVKSGKIPDYQIGLMIHAFADSYAHTTITNGEEFAFSYGVGHLFHGHSPDVIVHDPPKYKTYTCALYMALSQRQDCDMALVDLYKMIDALKTSRNAELSAFETYANDKEDYDQDLYDSVANDWDGKIGKKDIRGTIKLMQDSFN